MDPVGTGTGTGKGGATSPSVALTMPLIEAQGTQGATATGRWEVVPGATGGVRTEQYVNDRIAAPGVTPTEPKVAQLRGLITNITPELDRIIDSIPDAVYERKDKDNTPLIDHLIAVAKERDKAPRYLEPMIQRVQECGVSTQDQHGSCGAESLIRILNIVDVGEWARVSKELIIDGRSQLRSGEPLEAPLDARTEDASAHRDCFDRLMQSAFMNAAAPIGMEYSNQHQKFVDSATRTKQEEGTVDEAAKRLLDGFVARTVPGGPETLDYTRVKGEPLIAAGVLDEILRDVTGPPSQPRYMVIKWPDERDLHAVVLKGVDAAGNILFSNPHGVNPGGLDGQLLADPPRRLVCNQVGLQSMTRADFERHLAHILLPKYVADRDEKTPVWQRVEVALQVDSAVTKILPKLEDTCKTSPENTMKEAFFGEHLARRISALLDSVPATTEAASARSALAGLLGLPEHSPHLDRIETGLREATASHDIKSRDQLLGKAMRVIMSAPKMEQLRLKFLTENRAAALFPVESEEIERGRTRKDQLVSVLSRSLSTDQKILAGHQPPQAGRPARGGQPAVPGRPEMFRMVDDTIQGRVDLALRCHFEAKVRTLLDGIGRAAVVNKVLRQGHEGLNVVKIMQLATEARSRAPQVRTDIPSSFDKKTYQGEFSFSRVFGVATMAVSAAGMLAGPAAPGFFLLGAGMSLLNMFISGPKDHGYSWSKFRKGNSAAYPSDAELLAGLIATFNSVRGDCSKFPLHAESARKKYLDELVRAMILLVDEKGNVSNSTDQKKQHENRHHLMLDLLKAEKDFEQAGFGGYLDTVNSTVCFGGNLLVGIGRFVLLGF